MDEDLEINDEQVRALMVIPLMWASRMILANVEFLHDLQGMPIDDIMNNLRDHNDDIMNDLRDRKHS
jgi:hypothetical protein